MISDFEKKYPLDKRIKEFNSMHSRYPSRVPIIVFPSDETQPKIEKNKFLVPNDLTFSQFIYTMKKYLKTKSDQTIFIFTHNNNLVPSNWMVSELHDKYKKEDGFVYLFYSLENTFG
jgi:GABA(A) receptor-associated protein